MFVMSHFLLKITDLEDILCELVEFCVLSDIHVSKSRFKQINENLKLNVYTRTHVLGTCVQNFILSGGVYAVPDTETERYRKCTR